MSSSADDLRKQLKDLQARLHDTAKLGSTLQKAESELSLHIKKLENNELSKDEAAESTESLQTKLKRIQKDYEDYIGKSSPVVTPSKSSRFLSGFGGSSSKSKQQRVSQSSSEDVQFATNISETLIAECRKLKMELHEKNNELAELAEKQARQHKETSELKMLVEDLRRSETQVKDENWDLEVKLQELQSKMSAADVTVAKISSERGKLSSVKEDQVNQIEALKTREAELESELAKLKAHNDTLVSSLQKDRQGLEQENATLQSNLVDLKNELGSLTRLMASNAADSEEDFAFLGGSNASATTMSTDDDDDRFKTPTNSPPLSPIHQSSSSRNVVLENETIKTSLQHSHRQLANLRSHMMKERAEKLELKRQLSQLQSELENPKSSAGSVSSAAVAGGVRTKRSKFFAKQNAAVKRATSRLDISDESMTSSSGIYATAESGEEFQSAFETAQEDAGVSMTTEDEEFQTSNETADEGEDTETEQDHTDFSVNRRGPGFFSEDPALESTASLSSSSDEDHSGGDLSSRVSNRRSKTKKSIHTLRPLSEILGSASESTPQKPQGSLASEYLSVDDVKKHAQLHGLVAIPTDEYEHYVSSSKSGSNSDTIRELAAKDGLEVIIAKDMKTHIQDNVAPKYGMVAISKEEYEHLQKPTQESVRTAAAAVGGLVVLSHDEHNALKAPPSKDAVVNFAKNHNLKAIPVKEHERLVRDSTRIPTKEEIELYAKDMGLLAIPSEEYFGLVRYRDSPSPQSVEELAGKVGLVAVDQDSFNMWKNPTADFLQAKAGPLGMIMVDKVQYKNLGRLASSPSAEELTERAQKLGLHVLPESQYKELTRELTKEEVAQKAAAVSAVVVDKDHYENVKALASEPPVDHVKQKASALGLTTVTNDEYKALVSKADKPDSDHLKSKAAALGLTVVAAEHYKSLQDKIANPSLDELHTHAKNNDHVLLDAESHRNLLQPSMDTLKVKALQEGHVVVPKQDYDQLKKLAEAPTKDDVVSSANKVGGLVVLKSSEYDDLVNREPSKQEVQAVAEKYGLVTLPTEQFEKLSKDANVTIDKSFVESAAAGLGLVTLTSAALSKLKQPSLPDITAFATKHNHTLVSDKELAALKTPDANTIKNHAKNSGLVALPSDEYQSLLKERDDLAHKLKQPYEVQSQEEVEQFAAKFGLITVPEAVYKRLTAQPTTAKVASEAESLGFKVIPAEELKELQNRPKEFNPTHEELATLATSKFGSTIVTHDKLKELQSPPSREVLEKTASDQGLSVVPTSTLEELKRQASTPSQKELDIMAAKLSLAVVPAATIQELHDQITNPTEDYIRSTAEIKHGLKVIKSEEHAELKRRAEKPKFEEIKEYSAKNLNATILPVTEYEELTRRANKPSIDEVKLHSDNLGHVVVDKDLYDELERNATEPDKDRVMKFAKRLGLTAVADTELENLKSKNNHSPTLAELETHAKKFNMILVRQEDVATGTPLSSEQQQPSSPSAVSEKDMHLQSLAVKRNYFEDRIRQEREGTRPADKKVMDTVKSLGYVPISQEEYKRLLDNQQVYSPSKADIIRAAKSFGLTTVASDEYKALLRRNNVHGSRSSIGSLDAITVSSSTVDSRPATPEPGIKEGSIKRDASLTSVTSELDMKAVPASYLASLQRIAENPTKDDVLQLAEKVGLVVGGGAVGVASVSTKSDKSEKQISKEELSIDELKAKAKSAGLVTLTKEEHNKLANTKVSADDIQQQAKSLGLVTLTEAELQKLKQPAKVNIKNLMLTEEDVKAEAEKLGLVTLASGEYNYLKEPNAARVESDAEQLGLITVPTNVYKAMADRAAAHGPLSDSEVRAHADKLGLLVLSKDQMEEKIKNRLDTERKPQPQPQPQQINRAALEARARELGLVVLEEHDYKHLSTATVTGLDGVEDLDFRYKEVKSFSPPVHHQVPKTFSEGEHAATVNNGTASAAESINGSMRPPHAPLPSVSESGASEDSSITGGTSNRYHSAIAGATGAAIGAATIGSVSGSVRNIATGAAADYHHQRHGSVLDMSNMTIASQASFTDSTMIPLITQVVIGEFLFKYTRGMGISGITETRHERYFWIHPYSLTIHWTRENPGAQSARNPKTKSAAILAVKSVDDSNPLPPGLYSKSIVITTNNRTLKLTCLNRRRHNIWYNAIQYLIKRSTDELSFDEDFADEYTADAHLENERARHTPSVSNRSSNRALSIRRSMAPEINNNHIRHLQKAQVSSGTPVSRPATDGRQPSVSSFRTPSLIQPSPKAQSHGF